MGIGICVLMAAGTIIVLVAKIKEREAKQAMIDQWYDEFDNYEERYHMTPSEFAWKNRISSYYYHND